MAKSSKPATAPKAEKAKVVTKVSGKVTETVTTKKDNTGKEIKITELAVTGNK